MQHCLGFSEISVSSVSLSLLTWSSECTINKLFACGELIGYNCCPWGGTAMCKKLQMQAGCHDEAIIQYSPMCQPTQMKVGFDLCDAALLFQDQKSGLQATRLTASELQASYLLSNITAFFPTHPPTHPHIRARQNSPQTVVLSVLCGCWS